MGVAVTAGRPIWSCSGVASVEIGAGRQARLLTSVAVVKKKKQARSCGSILGTYRRIRVLPKAASTRTKSSDHPRSSIAHQETATLRDLIFSRWRSLNAGKCVSLVANSTLVAPRTMDLISPPSTQPQSQALRSRYRPPMVG